MALYYYYFVAYNTVIVVCGRYTMVYIMYICIRLIVECLHFAVKSIRVTSCLCIKCQSLCFNEWYQNISRKRYDTRDERRYSYDRRVWSKNLRCALQVWRLLHQSTYRGIYNILYNVLYTSLATRFSRLKDNMKTSTAYRSQKETEIIITIIRFRRGLAAVRRCSGSKMSLFVTSAYGLTARPTLKYNNK